MNIQQIKDDLNNTREEFNKRITELENKLAQKQDSKRWKPKEDEDYYFIDSCGNIFNTPWGDDDTENFRYSQYNCFKTKEEASEHLENLKIKAELRALAEELNGDRVIDWEDVEQKKYNISYIHDKCIPFSLSDNFDTTFQTQGIIYCLNTYFLRKAIERIGEDRLIKLIKSGV